jgi:molecular chaperone DnaK
MIGIDLGTSQSAGFYCEGKKKINCTEIKSKEAQSGEGIPENEKYHPSIVIYDETDGSVILGQKAKILGYHYPKTAIYDFKRLIGRGYDDPEVQRLKKILEERGHYELCSGDEGEVKIKIGNKKIAPEEAASEIIAEIIKDAFHYDTNLKINKMVISVPAYFGLIKRLKTKEAAVLAIKKLKEKYPGRIQIEVEGKRPDEIKNIKLISEPTASLITYSEKGGLEGVPEGKPIMVFDLGAGTLDITIGSHESITDMTTGEDKLLPNVLAKHGNNMLGGRDMDEKIEEWAKIELKKKNISIDYKIIPELKENAEKAKIWLSSRESTAIRLTSIYTDIPIDRKKLEEIIDPIIKQIRKEINTAMELGKIKKGEVAAIVMVGGPTFMPVVRKVVEDEVGIKIKDIKGWNPMLCVAEGAAKASGGALNPPERPTFDYLVSVDMFKDKNFGKLVISKDKDWLPSEKKEVIFKVPSYHTIGDIDKFKIRITERSYESQVSTKNTIVQEVEVPFIARADGTKPEPEKGSIIKYIEYSGIVNSGKLPFWYETIKFSCKIDENGILIEPTFTHQRTGKEIVYFNLSPPPGRLWIY